MTTNNPLETAAKAGFSGSNWGPTEPSQATGSPTNTANDDPTASKREQYSTRSAAPQLKGKEVDRDWYSLTGCWSSGTGHSVSGGVRPFLKDGDEEKGVMGLRR